MLHGAAAGSKRRSEQAPLQWKRPDGLGWERRQPATGALQQAADRRGEGVQQQLEQGEARGAGALRLKQREPGTDSDGADTSAVLLGLHRMGSKTDREIRGDAALKAVLARLRDVHT